MDLAARARDVASALAVASRRPGLGRAELAFGATCVAESAFTVGLGIAAFVEGGAPRVGLVAVVRLVPAAGLAPIATALADRWPRERVLIASSGLLAGATAAIAGVLASEGPAAMVYALAVVASVALTPYRAAHSALLPSLCQTSDELAASNIVRGTIESVGLVIGPLAAAALIELTTLWVVFAATAAMALLAAGLLVALPYERPPALGTTDRRRLTADVLVGLKATAANADASCLMLLAGAQTFLRGSLNVFALVLVVDVLETGESRVGILQATMGVGAVIGSLGAARLVGARRMAAWFGAAVVMWGLPISLIGVFPRFGWAMVMLAAIGIANAVLDVALFTMLARLVADEVLARAFGLFESLVAITVALGSAAAALAVDRLGLRSAMMLLGLIAPGAVLLGRSRLRGIDRHLGGRQEALDVLQQVPMLRALPVPTIEQLARRIVTKQLRPGEVLIREGTPGSEFYVIVAGEVEVYKRGRRIRSMGPGGGLGEISLLRGARRSATVTAGAQASVTLYALTGHDFLAAVGGYSAAASAAATAMDGYAGPATDADTPLRGGELGSPDSHLD